MVSISSMNGATPNTSSQTPATTNVSSKENAKPSIFTARQDSDGDGTIKGQELFDKGRFAATVLDFMPEKLKNLISNFSKTYDIHDKNSAADAENVAESFVSSVNQELKNNLIENLKEEQEALVQSGIDAGMSDARDAEVYGMHTYNDIDGNEHTEWYKHDGTLLDKTIKQPKE